jgi:hypothetical protein
VAAVTDAYVINANSTHVQEAVDYVLLALNSSSVDYGSSWEMAYNPQRTYHEAATAYYDRTIESIESMPPGSDQRTAGQPTLEQTPLARNAGDDALFAELRYLTPKEFDNMRTTALPNLSFHPLPDISGYTAAEKFIQNGTLDADGLIQYLDAAAVQEDAAFATVK